MTPLILHANALNIPLASGSIQCAVTSPPYWGLRDYGHPDQIGQEPVHDCLGWATGQPCGQCYVCHLVAVFHEVRRVLRSDGTLWLNLGDSYAGSGGAGGDYNPGGLRDGQPRFSGTAAIVRGKRNAPRWGGGNNPAPNGLKPKDLAGVPWRVALALQADGWYLRSEIIWHKPNPMPESVRDRPTKSHEQIFLFAKSAQYYYDPEAIKTPSKEPEDDRGARAKTDHKRNPTAEIAGIRASGTYALANARDVWSIPTHPYAGAHFATFPPKLIEPCILAGSRPGDTVLDPFSGAGTTALVATRFNRHAVGLEINPTYIQISLNRLTEIQPTLLPV